MQILESKIESQCCDYALKNYVRSIKLNVQGQTGWPDRLFLFPNKNAVSIEFKRPGFKPRPKQNFIHTILRNLGFEVYVIDNLDRFKHLFKTIQEKIANEFKLTKMESAPLSGESR